MRSLLSSSRVSESSCLQFCVAFLTPESSSFQTQFVSDFLLGTLGPLTRTPEEFKMGRVGGLQGRKSCVRRQNSKSLALG